MSDLIPLAELLAEIDREIKRVPACAATLQRARSIALTIPTVEAEPVVHARWNKAYRSGYVPKDGKPICSNCDCWNGGETTYCPRCGAKMDKEGT